MTHTLLTFLGRTPKAQEGYRTTCYDFGDGEACEPAAFFGWVLQRRLRPGRLVILGTAGSMWDHLFESDFNFAGEAEEQRLELAEAVEQQAVTQQQLDALEPLLAERLGSEVRLRLIAYSRTAEEQVTLLRVLADNVGQDDRVDLDITHGFRHLPMLALLSALHLRKVRQAGIAHIWYGSYDPDSGQALVHDLAGLLNIADWIEALTVYGQSGDYGVFASLVGGEIGDLLAEAGFLETVNRIGQARSRLRQVLKRLDEVDNNQTLLLFRDELKRRIAWAEQDNYYLRQRKLALEYLRRDRFMDAILTGWEAFTSRLLREAPGVTDPDNHQHREQVRKTFDSEQRKKYPRPQWEAFDSLRRLRNAVAHGSQPKGDEVQRALGGPEKMRSLLQRLFDQLLPAEIKT